VNEPEATPLTPSAALLRGVALAALAWCGFVAVAILASPLLSGYTLAAFAKVVSYGGVGCLAALAPPALSSEDLGLRSFSGRWLAASVLMLPLVLVVSELDNWVRVLAPYLGLAGSSAEMKNPDNVLGWIELGLALVAVIPIVEEWLFRGVIQARLTSALGERRAVFASAWLFALTVSVPSLDGVSALSAVLGTFLLGIFLGGLRARSGSVLAPILCRALMQLASVGALAVATRYPIPGFSTPEPHSPPLWVLGSALCVLGATLLLRQRS